MNKVLDCDTMLVPKNQKVPAIVDKNLLPKETETLLATATMTFSFPHQEANSSFLVSDLLGNLNLYHLKKILTS